ncbi:MAG: MmcQ/YjbR family DNA-binding protein [Methylobacteriaceae bacterium]|nr:MmcQ/YjbR family DNA-binding protein [Methylobacteriaceae bacterium]
MTYDELNAFCAKLPGASYVSQWGGAHVWKVGGKIFAVGGWNGGDVGVTFKASPIAFEALKDRPGLRPAPYLASRGLSWIQQHGSPGLTDEELLDHVRTSYEIVASRRPRAPKGALTPRAPSRTSGARRVRR